MTALLTKSERLSQGIDTIERSIVYALLALRQVNADGANKEAVQVTLSANAATDAINATLSGQAKLYYSSPTALTGGFNLLEAITPYGPLLPDLFQDFDPSVGLEEEIPEEPAAVETLEQFLLWCALILSASTHPLSLNYVKFSVFESADPPNLNIAFSLPLDYGKFLLTGNWIESVQKVFDYHITDPDQLISPFTIPPSQQFWGDPVNDLLVLSTLTGQAVGNTRWVHSEEAFYSLLAELPVGESLDGVVYVAGEADMVWRKGGVKGDPGDPGTPGADGNDGAPGLSAYEVAVANGFVGNEAAWLASLVGPTGPAGNDGADGVDGVDGDSAYAIAVDNGFVGTEQEWLDSLIGETGPAGLPGAGVDWQGHWNSATAYQENDAVSHNGSAYIANAANLNKVPGVDPEWDLWVAKGETGATGPAGPQGIQGETGPAGATGPQGPAGTSGHTIQDDGSAKTARTGLNFKGFKVTDDSPNDATIIQIADTLTDKALYYYDATAKLLKPIGIGTDGQALLAKPTLNPPYQFATPSGGREVLAANKTVWVKSNKTYAEVNQAGGSDTTGDGTELNPWLTIGKLSTYIATIDLNGFTLTCNLNGAFGTEGDNFTWLTPIGSGSVIIKDSAGNKNSTKLKGSFQVSSSTTPITFEQVTFQESISDLTVFTVPRGCQVVLKNCRVRSGYYVLRSEGGTLSVQGELIFRNYRQAPGNTSLRSLFNVQWGGLISVVAATIKTVTDDNDTSGALSFGDSMFFAETLGLVYAGSATFVGTPYACNTSNWLKSQRLANWSYA